MTARKAKANAKAKAGAKANANANAKAKAKAKAERSLAEGVVLARGGVDVGVDVAYYVGQVVELAA
jgi:hypothetical protein